jgi:hypothetical protein
MIFLVLMMGFANVMNVLIVVDILLVYNIHGVENVKRVIIDKQRSVVLNSLTKWRIGKHD